MSDNKLEKTFNPASWQWQDSAGRVHALDSLSRDDILQVACACLDVLERAEAACQSQQAIFTAFQKGSPFGLPSPSLS